MVNEVQEDEIVRYVVRIDELQSKVSELEYMLSESIQSGIEKDRLMRGTEDIVESISAQLEKTSMLIESYFPLKGISQNPGQKENLVSTQ